MGKCFYSSRIQLELMHKPNFSSRHAPTGGEPESTKQRRANKSIKDKSPKENAKSDLAEYTIKG